MKTSAALVKLVIFMIVTSILTLFLAATIGNITFGGKKSYSALFSDVTGLLTGNDVRIAGVKVGQVDKIELADRKLIERAKGILMSMKGLSEDEAYKQLRKKAMNEKRKIADIARAIVTAADLLG